MNENLKELYVKSGKLQGLINYLNAYPEELGGNNQHFKDTLKEILDLIDKVTELESVK